MYRLDIVVTRSPKHNKGKKVVTRSPKHNKGKKVVTVPHPFGLEFFGMIGLKDSGNLSRMLWQPEQDDDEETQNYGSSQKNGQRQQAGKHCMGTKVLSWGLFCCSTFKSLLVCCRTSSMWHCTMTWAQGLQVVLTMTKYSVHSSGMNCVRMAVCFNWLHAPPLGHIVQAPLLGLHREDATVLRCQYRHWKINQRTPGAWC